MSKEETIEYLFRTHYDVMFRLAVAMLHDADEAKDAVSEVFVRLLHGDALLPEKATGGYLLTSVRNRCLDIISHKQVKERVRQLLTADTQPDLSPVGPQTDHYKAVMEFADSCLTPQTRTVFRLRFEGRKSYRDISEQLGISEAAVYKHLAQALRKMKEHFNPNQQ
ncbi:MAG: sigma-70 family RNA polymerase sigma factor [Prevotella sp.]|nr:sigma-70 family RNA polymerase sigma factor [Prevotella sp.]